MHALGEECYIENGQVSVNCTDGTFCNIATNKCYRPNEAAPRVIYNPVGHDCMYHFDCEEGLYCAQHPTRDGRKICSVCQVAEGCPEKGSQPNYKTCKRGEYECPNVCLHENDQCRTTSGGPFGKTIKVGDCCRGMMCGVTGYCVNDERKTTGTCTDDNECADNYGCLNGRVVHAEGQICSSENGLVSPNCVGGTYCNTDTGTRYWHTGKTRVNYNSWLYMPCRFHIDCDIDLYCGNEMCQNCATKEGGCTVNEEKVERNIRRCKFEDKGCFGGNAYVRENETKVAGFSCCSGLKENNEGKCTTCKKTGACNDEDDDICDYYGCKDNKAVYAQQIKCETVDDCPRNDYSAFNDRIIVRVIRARCVLTLTMNAQPII